MAKTMSNIDKIEEFRGKKVTIMGLGLHGGGIASARFFSRVGARVTVTDLRDEQTLAPALLQLDGFTIRFVLGRHEKNDFSDADIVIKNPAVRTDSPYLALAHHIETDISIFLRFSRSPLIAVTGSKGKSSVASAIWYVLTQNGKNALLGGNITVSPLDFLEKTSPEVPVVLELSSWQLGDLRGNQNFKPSIAVITAIFPDHLNYYENMDAYVSDKRIIYKNQDESCWTICCADQEWGQSFARETKGKVAWYSENHSNIPSTKFIPYGWLEKTNDSSTSTKQGIENDLVGYGKFRAHSSQELLVPAQILVPGLHQKKNLLASAVALRAFGLSSEEIRKTFATFPGVPHRLEYVTTLKEAWWYNDSAATIPDAAIAAIHSFSNPIVLIAGGSDKKSDFFAFAEAAKGLKSLVLLQGSGTDRLLPLLNERHIAYHGPFGSMREAVDRAASLADPGDIVVLSPGCASFGMFLHEFDRGDAFKSEVLRIASQQEHQITP